MVFIVPASWLVLNNFSKLRLFLAHAGRLTVYYVGKVFQRRNGSSAVMVLEKNGKGMSLYDGEKLVVSKPDYGGELIRFETPQVLEFERSGIALGHLFDIYFAARSPEVRTRPQVSTRP